MTEWNAAEYSQRSGLQQAMAEEVLALLDLEGSERVLDVGCGDGKITAAIAARVPRGTVVGVDASRDMITFAASHFDPTVRANLRFEVADARLLPFRNEFNRVVSFNALHWVPDQDAALRSIRSAMTPDGQALLRLVSKGEGRKFGKCDRRDTPVGEMDRLLPRLPRSLFASHPRRIRGCSRAQRPACFAFILKRKRGISSRGRHFLISLQWGSWNGRGGCQRPSGRSSSIMSSIITGR